MRSISQGPKQVRKCSCLPVQTSKWYFHSPSSSISPTPRKLCLYVKKFFIYFLIVVQWLMIPISAGLCIYTHASRNTNSVLWPLLWLGRFHSWANRETGMLCNYFHLSNCPLWAHHSQASQLCLQINIRKRQDIHSRSSIGILEAQPNLYSAIIGEKVCMKIGDGSWCPTGREWTLATCGHRYAVWQK